ncbi:hypothetical protein BGZ72_010839 [Mortierella alpina]|nr:hypothetical protein BGZ72_010839 [Mortierella alpina]
MVLLAEKIRELCPCFDRLDAVFRTSLSRNPPPPFQSSKTSNVIPDDDSEGPSDLEEETDVDTPSETYTAEGGDDFVSRQASSSGGSGSHRANKRRRTRYSVKPDDLSELFLSIRDAAIAAGNARVQALDATLKDCRLREQALLERELGMNERLLNAEKIHQELMKERALEFEAMLKRRWQELLDEKEEFSAEKKEFLSTKKAFEEERIRLICENSNLKKDVEVTRFCTREKAS